MIVVLDIGTSNIRTVLVSPEGRLVYTKSAGYALCTPSFNAVEMDLALYEHALWEVLKAVGMHAHEQGIAIDAISVTGQRSSVIPVDEQGKALSSAFMWQDTRAQYVCDKHNPKLEKIYAITGTRPSPVFSAPKIQWLKEQHPSIYEKSHKIIGFCEYTLHLLTNVFATDHSIASRTCLFDITTLEWSGFLLDLFGIDASKLCPLVEVGSIVGETTQEVTDLLGINGSIPVISAGGDQQCAALGSGCILPGHYMINEGTGMYALGISQKPVFDPNKGTNCNLSAIAGTWIVEGAVLSAGKTMDWANTMFFASEGETYRYQNFTEASRRALPGSHGLRFSVQLVGKGTPKWDPGIHGALLNLSVSHSKDDIARALLEGLAVSAKECLDAVITVNEAPVDSIMISGGLTKDTFYDQIQADFFQRPIHRYTQGESTALGAWISARVALGQEKDHLSCFLALDANLEKQSFIPSAKYTELYTYIEEEILIYENETHRRPI